MTKDIVWSNLSETNLIASKVLANCNKKIAFYGNLGAGKTTLIKEMCKVLGFKENTDSPTFSILNIYEGENIIYHFDFYRIKSLDEVLELGFEEYFFSDEYVFLEWPEKIESLIPEDFSCIKIEINPDNTRKIIYC
jgi:tRNA threonylcarbamoyladenosine biosynthesis protein TsaE